MLSGPTGLVSRTVISGIAWLRSIIVHPSTRRFAPAQDEDLLLCTHHLLHPEPRCAASRVEGRTSLLQLSLQHLRLRDRQGAHRAAADISRGASLDRVLAGGGV